MKTSIRIAVPLAALATLAFGAPAAQALTLTCGQTVTSNVKLTADLDCSGGGNDGIVVGKAGITINLNGHTITGPGSGPSHHGINNGSGYNNVTVENGTVTDFRYNVLYEYSTGARIIGVHSAGDNYEGINVWYSQRGLVKNSTATNADDTAIYFYENQRVNASNVKATDSYYGMYDYYSLSKLDHVRASGNTYGIDLYSPLLGYLLKRSTATGNDYGIYVYDNYPTNIYQAKLVNNVANGNTSYGMYAEVTVLGSGNRAHNNPTDCFHVICNRKHKKHHHH